MHACIMHSVDDHDKSLGECCTCSTPDRKASSKTLARDAMAIRRRMERYLRCHACSPSDDEAAWYAQVGRELIPGLLVLVRK